MQRAYRIELQVLTSNHPHASITVMGTFGVVAMNAARLRRIVANLLRYVPDPPKPEARPTASFAGLKVGQRITDNGDRQWLVASTDSQGADLVFAQANHEGMGGRVVGDVLRLEDRNWKAAWSRVRAPRKPRKEKTL
jgi:hypothetical protein